MPCLVSSFNRSILDNFLFMLLKCFILLFITLEKNQKSQTPMLNNVGISLLSCYRLRILNLKPIIEIFKM